MVCVVWPFDQSQVSPALAVRSTESPGQKSTGPEAVMVGAGCGVLKVIMLIREVSDQHPDELWVCT